jgi:hypothetical protein
VVLLHTTSLELRHLHKPMTQEYLKVAWHNSGRNPIPLRHGSRRKGRQHLRYPGISSYFLFSIAFSFFPTLFLFARRRERGKERTVNGAQGCRGAQGQPPASNPVASVDKRLGPLRCSKGPSKLSLPTFPTPRTLCQLQQQGIQKLYSQCPPPLDG